MDKKIQWTAALAAYDQELDVLEATRNDYTAFLTQTRGDVIARVKDLSGEAFELRTWEATDVDPVGEWDPQGRGELGGLSVQVYAGSGEGMPGTFQIELTLDLEAAIPCEMVAVNLQDALALRNALLDGASSLPGQVKPSGPTLEKPVQLNSVSVDIAAKDLVDQVATHVVAYCQAAQRLSDSIALMSHASDPYRWARARLLEVRGTREEDLSAKGKWDWQTKGVKLDGWEGGRYLGVTKSVKGGTDDFWVTAMPNGEVVFTAHGPTTSDKARWKELCALAEGGQRNFNDGPGATLFEAKTVRKMAEAGKTREMCDKIVEVFQVFLR